MPGSGTHDGTVDLFSSEDIRQANELNKINQAGKGSGKAKGKGMSLFGRGRPLTPPHPSPCIHRWFLEVQKPRWLCNASKRPRWPVVWSRCPCVRPRLPLLLPILHRWISQFHIPPKMWYKQRRIQRKGVEVPKEFFLLPQPPVGTFFQRLRQRMKWWRLHAPPPLLDLIQHGVPSQWSPLHPLCS